MGCITPWLLMEAASSSREPGSMRVRGWYLPGRRSSTRSWRSSPSAASSSRLPESRASSPRPRPLSLGGVMVLCSEGLHAFHHFTGEDHVAEVALQLGGNLLLERHARIEHHP